MIRVALSQLRHRLGRTAALLVAIALATGSFVLLTGSADTSRLQVRGTVEENFRSSYDLLVRPLSSYTPLENQQGLVRPNYQSGIFGGITTDQLATIRSVVGVQVAAPVANVGYMNFGSAVRVPVQPYLNGDRQQLFRVRPTWTMDRGTSTFAGAPSYVYVSQNPTRVEKHLPYTRGDDFYRDVPTYAEVVPGRPRPVPVCTNYDIDRTAKAAAGGDDTPFGYRDPYARTGPTMSCYYTSTTPSGSVENMVIGAGDPAVMETVVPVQFPVLLAAVDPQAEAQLYGLDQAVVTGRALSADDQVTTGSDGNPVIPVLAASATAIDQQVSATVERVNAAPGRLLSDALTGQTGVVGKVAGLKATKIASIGPVSADQSYNDALSQASGKEYGIGVGNYWTVSGSRYDRRAEDLLTAQPVTNPESAYDPGQFGEPAPVGSDDAAVRSVTGHPMTANQQNYPGISVVGQFDPTKITGDPNLSGVTSETYVSPDLPGADAASQQHLGGHPLAPSTNLGGYLAQPPTLLTTLAGAQPLLDGTRYADASPAAPISVIRVRVDGIRGADPVSRERLNQVALTIGQRTGLAVDIVAGASGVPTTVVLPAGDHGRPELRLLEQWARKGVAYQVVDAVDRKSLALFGLILAVCTLVVANAASAAVRTRRTELGVLSCLGWSGARIFTAVEIELIFTGLAAGLLGTGVATLAGQLTGVATPISRALVAVPAATVLAALAGLAPARHASRVAPMAAVRPAVVAPRAPRPTRSVTGFALQGLRRVPGRTLLGASSLAVGVAAATFLIAVQQVFRGTVVGSLLGSAVTVQVRTPDILALTAVALLGAAGVADVLYIAAREQAAEYAVLRATGWTDSALTRTILTQGVVMGGLGSLLGATAGCLGVARFAGHLPLELLLIALGCSAAGTLLAGVAALLPALLICRQPIAVLVAEEN